MIESWKQSALAAMAIIAVLAVAASLQSWALTRTATAQPPVVVWEKSASPVSFPTPEEAMTYASSLRGFSIAAPTYLPLGYVLTEIDLSSRPSPPIQEHPSALFTVRCGSANLQIDVLYARPIDAGYGPGTVIATDPALGFVKKYVARNSVDYELISPAQVIDLSTPIPAPLADGEAVRILMSVPPNHANREWR